MDTCKNKIKEILLEDKAPLFFKKDLDSSTDNTLSDEIFSKAVASINALKKKALVHKPTYFSGVATEAFRSANNGDAFIQNLAAQLKFSIFILDQRSEAILGYLSALHRLNIDGKRVLVWDQGGGSAQFTTVNADYDFVIGGLKLGSETFKRMIISVIKGENPIQVTSPNPVGKKDAVMAERFAEFHAREFVPQEIVDKMQKTIIVGIGGVHYWSLKKTLNRDSMDNAYTFGEISRAIKNLQTKNDAEIGGAYASTDVSNLLLIKGFMKALNINQVKALNINLSHGILTNRAYWN